MVNFYRGLERLWELGPLLFIKRAVSEIRESARWKIKDTYELSVKDTSVIFSAPTKTVVRRNKDRYKSEQDVIIDLLSEIEPNEVFYDIGANTGLYALFAGKRCSNGKVIAFEPYPPNTYLLKQDIKRNDLGNVAVRQIALSNKDGTISFKQPDDDDISWGSASIDPASQDNTIDAPTRKGDTLVEQGEIPPPNVVKIDVEGAESLVIEGLAETLKTSCCRVVYCEIHLSKVEHRPSIHDFGVGQHEIEERLREFGFKTEQLKSRNGELLLKATKIDS